MHIQHLTLATGHVTGIERGDVAGEALARMGPWLAAAVESGESMPLPVSALGAYSGLALVLDGALIVTISGPPIDGRTPPLVTLGVAKRSRHGAALWPLMTGGTTPPARPGIQRPAEPWCAVAIWPTAALYPEALEWLGDLERCIAWAWVTRAEELQ